MLEVSYGDAVVSFINSIAYCQVLHVSSAGRVKGPHSNLWVWSPLRSLILSYLCEILRKHGMPADVIFNAVTFVNMSM
jgi:hypothetical protein